jgi:hypothetical protein
VHLLASWPLVIWFARLGRVRVREKGMRLMMKRLMKEIGRGGFWGCLCVVWNVLTHTHTHTERERERERGNSQISHAWMDGVKDKELAGLELKNQL